MGLFDGVSDANVRGGSGSYILAGTHVLALVECKYLPKTQSGPPAYVTEYRVVESSCHPVGLTVSWVLMRKQDPRSGGEEMFFSDLLSWSAALCGLDPQLDKGVIESDFRARASSLLEAIANGAMVGTLVRVLAQDRTSKKGNPWTHYTWTPYRRGDIATLPETSGAPA